MKLNDLETKFFDGILNAELDVPVPATLRCEGRDFDMIIVPEIAPEGYFRLKYFNAPAYEPEVGGDGTRSWVGEEMFGTHPVLKRAWQSRSHADLQLHPSPMPIEHGANPTLDVKVLFADYQHRGELVLYDNQVTLKGYSLNKVEFCILDFADFITVERQFASMAGISEEDNEILRRIASNLGDGAKLRTPNKKRSSVGSR